WESDSLEQYMGISSAYLADSNLYVSSRFYTLKEGIFEEVSAQLFSGLDENKLAEKVKATNIPTAQSKEILDYFKSPNSQPKETPFYIRFREKAFSCNLLADNDLKSDKLIGELIWENGSFKFQ
ncbi:MAG: hypothetical protein AAFU64_11980, partial [Bacteroidota bacterium]